LWVVQSMGREPVTHFLALAPDGRRQQGEQNHKRFTRDVPLEQGLGIVRGGHGLRGEMHWTW
jgi:hypothetical protein